MKHTLCLTDILLGLIVATLITCGPGPLKVSIVTSKPYAFFKDSVINQPLNIVDTVAFSRNDTIHTGDTVTFLGIIDPPDSRFTNVRWEFGDNSIATQPQPLHTYKNGGIYQSVFFIGDDVGNYLRDSVTVCVNTPPDSVQVVTPKNGSLLETSRIILSWKGYDKDIFDSSLAYAVVIDSGDGNDTIVRWSTETSTELILNNLQVKKISWFVIAKDKFGDVTSSSNDTFSVKANPAGNGDSLLSVLRISSGKLSPKFAPEVFEYNDTVLSGTSSVTLTIIPRDTSSAMYINNMLLGSRDSVVLIPLKNEMQNDILVKVVSSDKKTTKTYSIAVTIVNSVVSVPIDTIYLCSLSVSAGKLIPGSMPPEDSLWDTVLYSVPSIKLTATANDSAATIIIGSSDTIKSGATSNPVELQTGTTVIPVTVIHHNGTQAKTYIVSVYRPSIPDMLLSSLTVSAGNLKLVSAPVEDTSYDTVSFLDSIVTVTPTAFDSQSVISVDSFTGTSPSINVTVGTNEVTIRVSSSSGKESKTYILFIVRKADSSVPLTAPPSAIAAIGISVSAIHVSWNDNANATYYTVQRSRNAESGFTDAGRSTSNSFIDTSRDSGSTWFYRVRASNSNGSTDYSSVVSATTFIKPFFIKQPQSQKIIEGNRALFSVTAGGIPAPAYQWQENGRNIKDTTPNCTTAVRSLADNTTRFTCSISNNVGSMVSHEAVLTVDSSFTKPAILSQPGDISIFTGDSIALIITDSGSYLKRQWSKDNMALPQAVSCTLVIKNAGLTDAGMYSVKVWNRSDSAVCTPFRLRVLPIGDAGLSAKALSASSVDVTWNQINGASWYRILRASGTGDFAPVCSTSQTAMIDSLLTEGTSYSYKLISGNSSGEKATNDSVAATTWYGPQIATHPQPLRIIAGEPLALSVVASGLPACTYQWRKDGAVIYSATQNIFSIPISSPSDSGDYVVQVTNAVRSITSNTAHVSIIPTYSLSASALPVAGGTVTRNKTATVYQQGDTVKLTARAATGYRFTGWSGETATADSTVTIVMRKNVVIIAHFVKQFRLTRSIGKGLGTISPSVDTTCDSGAVLTTIAAPASDYRFTGWTGDTTASNTNLSINVYKNRSITANFVRQYTLTLTHTGSGSITPSGTTVVDSGVPVTLTATSNSGSAFVNWSVISGTATITNPATVSSSVILLQGNAGVEGTFHGANGSIGCGKTLGDISTSGTYTVTSSATNRTFIVDIPENYDKDKSYRLIFAMHCMNGSAVKVSGTTSDQTAYFYHIKPLAANDSIPCIFVAPQGNSDGTWTASTDTLFFKDLLNLLKDTLCIDTTRVFSVGFSFGAMYNYALSLLYPTKLRAVACIAPTNIAFPQPVNNHVPIAYYQTTGTADATCKWINSDARKEGGKYCLLQHVEDNGCSSSTTINLATSQTHVVTEFEGCNGYPVKFSSHNGGHECNVSDSGSTVDWVPVEIWDFFKRF